MTKQSGFRCPHCDNWIGGITPQKSTGQVIDEAANHVMKKVLWFIIIVSVIIFILAST